MRLTIILLLLFSNDCLAQFEFSTGYAVNRNLADGAPIQVAYDIRIKNRLFTKSQLGFKYLYHYNDFVGATMRTYIWELHQTLSYEIIKKQKYILKPNIGLSYRFYKWKAQMKLPLNSLPIRAWTIGTREGNFVVVSRDGEDYKEYSPNNLGFSFQLQNQFKLSDRVWLHITPFIEPDYDRSQNTGGCYVGVLLKQR
jgi:hypothetical protein